MKSVVPYLQEAKDEIIREYRQSGLSQSKFCNLPEVPITNSTLVEEGWGRQTARPQHHLLQHRGEFQARGQGG
jgi:hypothetical protein